MRTRQIAAGLLLSIASPFLAGCNLPGRPKAGPEVPRPEEIRTFDALYRQNCAACHGAEGQQGSATNLANPLYEAWIDDASLRSAIAKGEKGSLMPAFALNQGGTLTETQIDILAHGLRTNWGTRTVTGGTAPPPYPASGAGIAIQGGAVYAQACARCHGSTALKPGPAGSILDPSFLALMNAQTLRTTIVAGRPDIGQPDWRNDVPGHELTDAEVTNVTAWLLAQAVSPPTNGASQGGHDSGYVAEVQPLAHKK
jgi:cytochrome c oxidase cbb3-type subunit 3